MELRKEIKSKNFKRSYLFYGDENYLVKLYEAELTEALLSVEAKMMNMDVFEGKEVSVAEIIDAADTLPFMSDYRLVICKNTMLFVSGKKDESEKMANFINEVPETTVLLFSEPEVDKRGRLYKKLAEHGRAVEFKSPTEKELIDWICRTIKKAGKEIPPDCAAHLLKTVPDDMDSVMSEMEKLISYKADAREIKTSDIDEVCTKSLETRIFDLVDAVGARRADTALDIFSNLMLMKESPVMVISMIARQFRLLLQCKYLANKGMGEPDITRTLGQRSFVVKGILKQCANFTVGQLYSAFTDCLEADVSIKTGKISDRLAVEMLILKYSKA